MSDGKIVDNFTSQKLPVQNCDSPRGKQTIRNLWKMENASIP